MIRLLHVVSSALMFGVGVGAFWFMLTTARSGNPAAIALYQAAGFVTFGTVPEALQVDGAFHDEICMRLVLAAPFSSENG